MANAALRSRCDALPDELQKALAEMETAFDYRIRELETEHEREVARREAAHETVVAEVEAAGAAALSAQYLWFARQLRR